MNLLNWVNNWLHLYKKSSKQIDWVGSINGKYVLTWKEFIKMAKTITYRELPLDFVIVGKKNWWMTISGVSNNQILLLKELPKKQNTIKKYTLTIDYCICGCKYTSLIFNKL